MESLKQWEQRENESSEAFAAFDEYLNMGADRSLSKVAQALGKSKQLMARWSQRDGWAKRALAWDRHQARVTNEAILVGTAEMRKRIISQAQDMQSKVATRLMTMSDADIQALTPTQLVQLFRAASEAEAKARKVTEAELEGADEAQTVPTIHVHFARPLPDGFVYVRLADGVTNGCIPRSRVEEFRKDHPDALVIA